MLKFNYILVRCKTNLLNYYTISLNNQENNYHVLVVIIISLTLILYDLFIKLIFLFIILGLFYFSISKQS